jgi:NAD(P)H-flavin reductase
MSARESSAIADNPWLAEGVEIVAITPEVPAVATYRLRFTDASRAAGFRFRPGQFNMLYLPGVGEVAISISSAPEAGVPLDHTIRVAGNVTRTLAGLGAGGHLALRGPYGSAWPLEECAGADLIVVAGGIGLAPLRPVLYAWLAGRRRFGRLVLLYGARTPDGLLYTREYEAWTDRGIELATTVDRFQPGWTGNVGVVTLLVDRLRPLVPANAAVFVCGPEVMMRYTVRSALARGIGKHQIWVSLERNMQCAVGLCGHCQLGPAFVCKDGPVFRYDLIEPYLNVEAL